MTTIASVVPLADVLTELARTRPVFHSEADFQFAFGATLKALSPALHVRLEVPRRRRDTGRSEYLDVLAFGAHGRTAIELKYPTAAWTGLVPVGEGEDDELFELRSHSATDLARHGFVHDVYRLEQTEIAVQGVAVILSNVAGLWSPNVGSRPTRDHAFRIHEGRRLTGDLVWGSGDFRSNDRSLRGDYSINWHDYSRLGSGANGLFRWAAVETRSAGG